ncbi:hypothetical protein D8674_034614 [Pyrus ussuriensis x Pyrus communis]|uniref:Uncharacterized protein n=1 Tax=Pyrus ussuriensis x Pyrus communis TaxID=2448454 RepID=A0A5N5GAE6_9ROSA|nr:hypothetical protein D8674_034614 [Pyrus ussuriensis x Pyrus communis]
MAMEGERGGGVGVSALLMQMGGRVWGHQQTLLRVECAGSCAACLKSKDKFLFKLYSLMLPWIF